MRWVVVALMLAGGSLVLTAQRAEAAGVPFVGCASDGQLGPQAPPRDGPTPAVPAYAAPRLAFYAMDIDGTGILAPRGWRCFGLYGSNGTTLVVAPHSLSWKRLTGGRGLSGPAVQISTSSGSTSGRFEVARVAARLFPAAKAFVDGVEAEGMGDQPLVRRPYPYDRVTYRGRTQALFTTPAGKEGLGTESKLVPAVLPIDGVAILYPDDEMSLRVLDARLPASLRPLVAVIIRDVQSRR